jgi:hypothetical protein
MNQNSEDYSFDSLVSLVDVVNVLLCVLDNHNINKADWPDVFVSLFQTRDLNDKLHESPLDLVRQKRWDWELELVLKV